MLPHGRGKRINLHELSIQQENFLNRSELEKDTR
jgi:hypothetical protein